MKHNPFLSREANTVVDTETLRSRLAMATSLAPRLVSGDAYYDTATLLEVVYAPQNQPGLDGFWLRWYPTAVNSQQEKILFDDVDLNEYRLAPFVAPNVQGRILRSKGYSTRSFRPAYVKPKHEVDPGRAIPRLAGERLLGELSLEQRYDAIIADNIRRERAMIENRWDWMACQGLVQGHVDVAGEDYPTVRVDFMRDPRLTNILTGTAKWDQATATVMPSINRMRLLSFQLSRAPVTTLVFGLDAWAAFLLPFHQDVRDLLNAQRFGNESLFNANNVATGAPYAYQGHIVGTGGVGKLELWTYANFYEDMDTGVATPYMDPGLVVGLGDAVQGVQCFGAIKDRRASLQSLAIFPKMWDEEDPSVTYTMSQSAPLPIPVRANNTFAMKVVGSA